MCSTCSFCWEVGATVSDCAIAGVLQGTPANFFVAIVRFRRIHLIAFPRRVTIFPMKSRVIIDAVLAVAAVSIGATASFSMAAQKLIVTESIPDFNLSTIPVEVHVPFAVGDPVNGVGFTANWIAVIADNEDGLFPWSLDLHPIVEAPTGEILNWPVVGGDVTIASFPLQDFSGAGFPSVIGTGSFIWTFHNSTPQAPYTMGLRNVQLHLTTTVPDVVEVRNDTTVDGPMWRRPFYINGVSGLGIVRYHVIEFEVDVAGGYTFQSVVPSGDNFNFLYQGGFNPGDPNTPGNTGQLANLLDYGLGNGNAPNGTPRGTSLISAMLFENTRYYYVTSQWAPTTPPQAFTTTITGPGAIDDDLNDCPADLTNSGGKMPDGTVNVFDLFVLLSNWNTSGPGAELADATNLVDVFDLFVLLGAWGDCQ